MVRVNTVSRQANRDRLGRVLPGKRRKGERGVEGALKLLCGLDFYKKRSRGKYRRIAMCKRDRCWWERGLVVKQRGVVLTLLGGMFPCW